MSQIGEKYSQKKETSLRKKETFLSKIIVQMYVSIQFFKIDNTKPIKLEQIKVRKFLNKVLVFGSKKWQQLITKQNYQIELLNLKKELELLKSSIDSKVQLVENQKQIDLNTKCLATNLLSFESTSAA